MKLTLITLHRKYKKTPAQGYLIKVFIKAGTLVK